MNYIAINLTTLLFFIFFNPFYALFAATFLSVVTNKLNNLLLGLLYSLSFAIFFSNQEYLNSDLSEYINLYHKTESQTFLEIFKSFLISPHHKEFLWFFYNKIIGLVTGYSTLGFLFSTYMMIFTLSAYLAFLFSENGRYNFSLMLFALILFDVTFLNAGYNLWRNIFSVLVFLIGLIKYFSFHSKLTSRVILYSAAFFHISAIPLIGIFELYLWFINTNKRYVSLNILLTIKLVLFVSGIILLAFYFNKLLIGSSIEVLKVFSSGIQIYESKNSNDFYFMDYVGPLYAIFVFYIIYSRRKLTQIELYIIASFLIIEFLQFTSNDLSMLYSRASLVPKIGLLFISMKAFSFFNFRYVLLAIFVIFLLRILIFLNNPELIYLKDIANGESLNLFFGLFKSIYLYNPSSYSSIYSSSYVSPGGF